MTLTLCKMSVDELADYSHINFPEDRIWYRIPEWEVILKVTTFVPVIVFGIVGNLIIIYLIHQNRALRTPTNLLIVNMAAADMATLLICPVMFMYNDFYQNYMLGPVGCQLEGFLEGSLLITAVLNLSAVSYDRLTAIVLPMEARLTMKGAKVVMLLTWLAGFAIATPLAIYRTYKVRVWMNFTEKYCKENPDILPKYWYVLISALVWFPLGVMLVSYIAIFIKLDLYEKQVLNRDHPLTVSYKKTVAKTLFIVVIVFIALRVPFTVLVFIRADLLNTYNGAVNSSYRILWYTAHYLMFLNSAINPLIYGYTNDNLRRAYDQTPLCRCCCRSKVNNRAGKKTLPRGASYCCNGNGLCSWMTLRSRNVDVNGNTTKKTKSPLSNRCTTRETAVAMNFKWIDDTSELK